MFDPRDTQHPDEARVPAWLARDLGIHPSTRLDATSLSTRRRGAWFGRLRRRSGADEVMAAIPLFEGLSKKDRQLASQLSTTVTVPAGADAHAGGRGRRGVLRRARRRGRGVPGRPGGRHARSGLAARRGRTARRQPAYRDAAREDSRLDARLGAPGVQQPADAVPEISERLRALSAERRAA